MQRLGKIFYAAYPFNFKRSNKWFSEEELFKKSKINNLEKELSDEKEFNEVINEINKAEHRHFSYPVGVSYIIFGVLLMFADFPISLSIAKYFIDLPIEFEDSFFNKISHPEIVLFALGITFLSIYFKIIYDDYINANIFNKRK
ncbi:MAG: hypothetical protein IPI23_19345 [Bacteroidetes bacterium]|nr:hypothetical protein [Bacteroidota bacterium]